MRSFHRALLGFNNLQMHSYNIVQLFVYVKNTQSAPPNGEFSQVSGRLYFLLFQRKLCVIFSISFLMHFGLNTNLAYVAKLGKEGVVVYNYLFYLSKMVSPCSRQGFFCYTIAYFVPFCVISRIELPKLTSGILTEIVTILVVLVDQFYLIQFYYMHHQPI